MFRPLPLYIGFRYTRSRRRNGFISFISASSLLGIALGVLVLITALAVMNGFEQEVRQRTLSFLSHVQVGARGEGLRDWPELARRLAALDGVRAVAPYIEREGLLNHGRKVQAAVIRGVLPQREVRVTNLGKRMQVGALADLKAGGNGVILGTGLARILGVAVGDRVTLVLPRVKAGQRGVTPSLHPLTVRGIFHTGMKKYDEGVVLMHLEDARHLWHMGERVGGLRLTLEDPFAAAEFARRLPQILPPSFWVTDWSRRNGNFFRALAMQKRMIFVILSLIVAVAAFNIVSSLVMAVKEKEADIAILRTQGLSPGEVMGIFVVQGLVVGGLGVLLGVLGGVALAENLSALVAFLQDRLGLRLFESSVYLIDQLPARLVWSDVWVTALIAFAISVLATLYPSWRASRVQPAQALRYE